MHISISFNVRENHEEAYRKIKVSRRIVDQFLNDSYKLALSFAILFIHLPVLFMLDSLLGAWNIDLKILIITTVY